MATVIICIILIICIIFGVKSYAKRLSSGCCGSSGEGPVKRKKVADKNPAHYPYEVQLTIDGMTCGNCAARVENALNELDGVWAKVDLGSQQAKVQMKSLIPESDLKNAVHQVGYTVMKIQKADTN